MLLRGVALLAACFVAGQILGETLGRFLGIQANVGGVGFAMLFLILYQNAVFVEVSSLWGVEIMHDYC